MLMADGFWVVLVFRIAHAAFEVPAGVFAARLPCHRQSPLAEFLFQEITVELRQIAHRLDTKILQVLLRHLAHARDLSYLEGRKERLLTSGEDVANAVGLSLV